MLAEKQVGVINEGASFLRRLPGWEGRLLVDGWYRVCGGRGRRAGAAARLRARVHGRVGRLRGGGADRERRSGVAHAGGKGPQHRCLSAAVSEGEPDGAGAAAGLTRAVCVKRRQKLEAGGGAVDETEQRARALLKAWESLWAAALPEPCPDAEERLGRVITAVAAAAVARHGEAAGLWVQRLEEAAAATWQRVAAAEPLKR